MLKIWTLVVVVLVSVCTGQDAPSPQALAPSTTAKSLGDGNVTLAAVTAAGSFDGKLGRWIVERYAL
jgi:hypothetical protein